MNREIKFRAWDGSKMYLPEYSDKEDFHILADGTIVETHERGYERHELTSRRPDNWLIMQYTGLKDKHGVEIYEGDIVTQTTRSIKKPIETGTIVYASGAYEIEISKNDWTDIMPHCEIIGNIHQHPELLNPTT